MHGNIPDSTTFICPCLVIIKISVGGPIEPRSSIKKQLIQPLNHQHCLMNRFSGLGWTMELDQTEFIGRNASHLGVSSSAMKVTRVMVSGRR